jgi:two-component system, LuxR family, response regulator FixJ
MGHVENPTVFVVEDEPETRDSFTALISSMDLAAETFASGEEFLQDVDAGRPGCAVVDFRLAGMDGIELHHRLVEAGCKLPVILISACLTVRATAGALEQGVFRVLEKPYRNDELASAIRDAIKHDRTRRAQKLHRLDLEHRFESLDGRERRTLDLILAGHPNKAIERRLGLSRRTVERVRSSILAKTNFLSFVELSAAYGEARAAEGNDSRSTAAAAGRPSPSVPVSTTVAEMPQDHCVEDERDWRLLCCDLHDGAAQYVSAALLRLQAVEAQHEIPAEARPHLCMAGTLLDIALRDIREIIAGRSPACCTQPGIIPSIKRLVQELAETSGIKVEFVDSLGRKKLPLPLGTAVYRILQECLNNAIRHSGSDRVRVEIVGAPGALRLEVRDWGDGFDPDTVTVEHRGLRGIRERAELLGGRASFKTRPGGGTLVAVELPLTAS